MAVRPVVVERRYDGEKIERWSERDERESDGAGQRGLAGTRPGDGSGTNCNGHEPAWVVEQRTLICAIPLPV